MSPPTSDMPNRTDRPELSRLLAALYTAFTDAELQALQYGRSRLAALLDTEAIPEDTTVSVYHATDVEVTLKTGLITRDGDDGLAVHAAPVDAKDASELSFSIDLFDVLDHADVEDWSPGKHQPTHFDPAVLDDGSTADTAREPAQPIDIVDVIDPRDRTRLKSAGIDRLDTLRLQSAESLATAASNDDREVTPAEAAEWLDAADELATTLAEREATLPVELVNGIGETFGERLREQGIADLTDLVEHSPEEIAERASTQESSVSTDRATTWIDRATAILSAVESSEHNP